MTVAVGRGGVAVAVPGGTGVKVGIVQTSPGTAVAQTGGGTGLGVHAGVAVAHWHVSPGWAGQMAGSGVEVPTTRVSHVAGVGGAVLSAISRRSDVWSPLAAASVASYWFLDAALGPVGEGEAFDGAVAGRVSAAVGQEATRKGVAFATVSSATASASAVTAHISGVALSWRGGFGRGCGLATGGRPNVSVGGKGGDGACRRGHERAIL